MVRISLLVSLLLATGCYPVTEVPQPPLRFSAVGYGTESSYPGHSATQRQLLAIRASRLDALRNIAEEVYGVRIRGTTAVRDMAADSDSIRTYLQAHIRNARLLSITPKPDGIYETELELYIPQEVWLCLQAPNHSCLRQRYVEHDDMPRQALYSWTPCPTGCAASCSGAFCGPGRYPT